MFKNCLPLCVISPSSVMINRSVFDDVSLFDETLPACEDYDLWLRICAKYKVDFIDEPLVRKHGGLMLFLDGVYVNSANGTAKRFCRARAPMSSDLTQLTHTIAQRIGRFLECQGILERDAENSYLVLVEGEAGPMDLLRGRSI